MKLGYARVSTDLQNPDLQLDALHSAGCDRIWTDRVSGAVLARPELEALIDHARPGDTVIVWKLDRLGRSVKDLVALMTEFEKRNIGFKSITENIDTTTAGGVLIFHVFAALAQFERDLIRARTIAGLNAARSRGRVGGRPPSLTEEQKTTIDALLSNNQPIATIARSVGTSRATIYRHLAEKGSQS